MNYEEETKDINPEFTENLSDPNADKDISENIDDPRMWYNDNIINILLIGRDLGHGSKYYSRADSIIVVSINKLNNNIKLVSLSRATYVSIPGHGNARLNAAHAYGGSKLLIDTIEQNYKIRIDHYVSIDFNGFIKAIDALGGVDIALTESEVKALSPILKQNGSVVKGAGTYHLNGNEARICPPARNRQRQSENRAPANDSYGNLREVQEDVLDRKLFDPAQQEHEVPRSGSAAREHRFHKERDNQPGNDIRRISQVARDRSYHPERQDSADEDKRH